MIQLGLSNIRSFIFISLSHLLSQMKIPSFFDLGSYF